MNGDIVGSGVFGGAPAMVAQPVKKSKKKLIILMASTLLVVATVLAAILWLMAWDNGRSLSIFPDEDSFKMLTLEELVVEAQDETQESGGMNMSM